MLPRNVHLEEGVDVWDESGLVVGQIEKTCVVLDHRFGRCIDNRYFAHLGFSMRNVGLG